MTRSTVEGIPQALSKLQIKVRRVSHLDQGETAVRGQGRSQSH